MKHTQIRDRLAFDLMQAQSKEYLEIERIELSYDSMDALISEDSVNMRHIRFGLVEWRGVTIKPTDTLNSGQYRIVTMNK